MLLFILSISSVVIAQENHDAETGTSNFMDVVKSNVFVDKTMLIKEIFRHRSVLITAPRGFGKSTNLDMLRTFVTIPVDLLGNKDKNSFYERLDVFKKLELHKKEPLFCEGKFGTYPVVYIDFKNFKVIRCLEEATKVIKKKVHLSYKMHTYLRDSDKLTSSEKKMYKIWLGDYDDGLEVPIDVKTLSLVDVVKSLLRLAKYLYKHFGGRKVFVLVDNYDAVINNVMFQTTEMILHDVTTLISNMYFEIVEETPYIEKVLLTGVTNVAESEVSRLDKLVKFKFLDIHPAVGFYGFTESEVDRLFTKFKLSSEEITDARYWYFGYASRKGVHVYNPLSVVNFLKHRVIRNYWTESEKGDALELIVRFSAVEDDVRLLVREECIQVDFVNFSTIDMSKVKHLLGNEYLPTDLNNFRNNYFTYLFELGYLSFDEKEESCLRIPNNEIQEAYSNKLRHYYNKKYDLFILQTVRCSALLTNFVSLDMDSGKFMDELKQLCTAIKAMYNMLQTDNLEKLANKTVIEHVLFTVVSNVTGFVLKSRPHVEYTDKDGTKKTDRLDVYLRSGSFATIIEVKHSGNDAPDAETPLRKILDRQYYNVFNNKRYTPRKIKRYAFFGIGINTLANVSVSCLLNSKNISHAMAVMRIFQQPDHACWHLA